ADLEGESATNLSSIRATWASGNAGAVGMEIRAGNGAPPVFDLTVDHIYVTQAAQTLNDSEALIAGRPALVRVFVRATLNSASVPSVRLSFNNGSTLLSSVNIAGTVPAPTVLNEGDLSTTWNYSVPGSLVQSGISITAEVDPDQLITEGNEGNNTLTFVEPVRTTAPQSYRFVPIKQTGNGLTGNVTSANLSTYGDTAYRLFPITQPALSLHATYTTSTNVDANTDAVWTQILSEIDALRVAENSPATYVGVVRITYTVGITGIGYIGRPTAVVYDDQTWRGVTVAHELGHTYNRQHAPGCGAGSPDKNYPYAGGIDGVYGTDVFSSPALLYAPTIHDIMGYCDDNWISDYTYNGILNYIATSNLMAAALPAQHSILVWGSIVNGLPYLEPAFVLTTQPAAPSAVGSYRVQGLDKDGAVLFTQAFEPTAVADVRIGEASTFAFALPLSDATQSQLVSLRLVGRGAQFLRAMTAAGPQGVAPVPAQGAVQSWQGNRATITWDTSAAPLVMVRDVASGQVLSIGRGGRVEVETRGGELDLLMSNGVASTVQRLKPTR
ncbi:MAG TPA: hypothetical protein VFI79_16585, partial [Gemmatimonadales bacterium]|nr:hypothetical protein [Gemmatimonadales bacterium]